MRPLCASPGPSDQALPRIGAGGRQAARWRRGAGCPRLGEVCCEPRRRPRSGSPAAARPSLRRTGRRGRAPAWPGPPGAASAPVIIPSSDAAACGHGGQALAGSRLHVAGEHAGHPGVAGSGGTDACLLGFRDGDRSRLVAHQVSASRPWPAAAEQLAGERSLPAEEARKLGFPDKAMTTLSGRAPRMSG